MAWLADRNLIDYDAPLAARWPAFGAHGKDKVTIGAALAHQAGVPGFIDPIDPDLWLDPPACAAAIAALEPLWPPGGASGYHPLTWGYIVGEIARRAADRSVGAILREEICTPHGIDFQIGTPESEHHRAAEMKKPSRVADFGEITPRAKRRFHALVSPQRGSTQWRRIKLPSANGHATALGVARLYELYATGGEIAGERILSPGGFAALTEPRFKGDDLVLPFNVDWRAGVMANSNRFYGPNSEAFGHSGAGGSSGFGDPRTGVAAGCDEQAFALCGRRSPTLARSRRLRLPLTQTETAPPRPAPAYMRLPKGAGIHVDPTRVVERLEIVRRGLGRTARPQARGDRAAARLEISASVQSRCSSELGAPDDAGIEGDLGASSRQAWAAHAENERGGDRCFRANRRAPRLCAHKKRSPPRRRFRPRCFPPWRCAYQRR